MPYALIIICAVILYSFIIIAWIGIIKESLSIVLGIAVFSTLAFIHQISIMEFIPAISSLIMVLLNVGYAHIVLHGRKPSSPAVQQISYQQRF